MKDDTLYVYNYVLLAFRSIVKLVVIKKEAANRNALPNNNEFQKCECGNKIKRRNPRARRSGKKNVLFMRDMQDIRPWIIANATAILKENDPGNRPAF